MSIAPITDVPSQNTPSIALLCAGQGAQYPGMGKDLSEVYPVAAEIFALADEVRPGTSAQCFGEASEQELAQTETTQPCVLATDLACARVLIQEGVRPAAVAGFSLGELAALALSGAYSNRCAFELVIKRSALMETAATASNGSMAAVVGVTATDLAERLSKNGLGALELVNFNSPKQTVVSGLREDIEKLRARARELRLRVMPLAVSGAFHSRFMAPATEGFAHVVENIDFNPVQIPVYANATGGIYPSDAASMKQVLSQQISAPVHWTETVRAMAASGIDTFVEVGPGRVLTGLVQKILPRARVYSTGTVDGITSTLEALL